MSKVNTPKLESIHIKVNEQCDSKEDRIKALLAIAIAHYIESKQELA